MKKGKMLTAEEIKTFMTPKPAVKTEFTARVECGHIRVYKNGKFLFSRFNTEVVRQDLAEQGVIFEERNK